MLLELFQRFKIEPDAKAVRMLEIADPKALEMYRASAHNLPPARLLEADAQERARRTVLELLAGGKGFAELDWTRYDLSGLDLRDADCRKTLLEGADLTKANLARADLSGAVLAHGADEGNALRRREAGGHEPRGHRGGGGQASTEPTCARQSSLEASSGPSRSRAPTSPGWTGFWLTSARLISRRRPSS